MKNAILAGLGIAALIAMCSSAKAQQGAVPFTCAPIAALEDWSDVKREPIMQDGDGDQWAIFTLKGARAIGFIHDEQGTKFFCVVVQEQGKST